MNPKIVQALTAALATIADGFTVADVGDDTLLSYEHGEVSFTIEKDAPQHLVLFGHFMGDHSVVYEATVSTFSVEQAATNIEQWAVQLSITDDWQTISTYSRAQALEDGVLIDVTDTAKEAGFKVPVAVTSGVWSSCVAMTQAARTMGCDARGRLWDVLWIASLTARRNRDTDRIAFQVLVVQDATVPEPVNLWLVIGPGDDPRPVITICLAGED